MESYIRGVTDYEIAHKKRIQQNNAMAVKLGIDGLKSSLDAIQCKRCLPTDLCSEYDPKFATSPIFVIDKDYEFSVDPELITFVESDPFHGQYTTKKRHIRDILGQTKIFSVILMTLL